MTIDTMRADRLGRGGLTPTLDRLAARGTRFTRAYAHAPTTLPSHASILTGLLPSTHGARNNGTFRLAAATTTLAESLRAAGYATGAFVSAFVLDSRFGLDQGFDTYDDRTPAPVVGAMAAFRFNERRAPDTLRPAADWIRRQQQPWLAWVHLFDPHAPYAAPGFRSQTASPKDQHRAYDAEVAAVDKALDQFFVGLGEAMSRTIVVVTADHGESLGEHGESTHGLFAYDATLRVPLVMAGPGVAAAVRSETVAHVDITPTVLQLVGAGAKGAAVDGRSLANALTGSALPDRPIYFEALDASLTRGWAPLTGVIADGWKYIDLPLPELYDLRADADEKTNRLTEDSKRAAALRDLTSRLGSKVQPTPGTSVQADTEARARLRSLGYISGGAPRAGSWRRQDDPKALLPLHVRFQKAADTAARDPEAALREFRALIDARPSSAAAYEAAAALLLETGRSRDAVTLLGQAQARGLRDRVLTERLGAALLASGDAPAAVALLEPAARTEPEAIDLLQTLALAYVGAGNLAGAKDTLTGILRLDPTASSAWTNLGTINLQTGATPAAREAFERALEHDAESAAAWKGLGAAIETSDPQRATRAWERALTLAPNDYQLLARLAFLLAKSNISRATPYLERLIRDAPDARFAAEKTTAKALLKK